MKGARSPFCAGLLILLAGCGQPLGEFAVTDAVSVDGAQLNAVDPIGFPNEERSDLLQIRSLSLTNLTDAAQSVSNIYVDAWSCDDPSRKMWSVGPYYDDQYPVLPGRETVETRPDGGQTIRITGGGPRQPPRTADGHYRYTIYLALAQPAFRGHGLPSRPAYDLREHPVDVCLRLHEVGYWIKAPQSQIVRVSEARLRAALAKGQTPASTHAQ